LIQNHSASSPRDIKLYKAQSISANKTKRTQIKLADEAFGLYRFIRKEMRRNKPETVKTEAIFHCRGIDLQNLWNHALSNKLRHTITTGITARVQSPLE
jgi:hypothetical protein